MKNGIYRLFFYLLVGTSLINLPPASYWAQDKETGWWPPFSPSLPIPSSPQPPPQKERIEIREVEMAGISGFRKFWDRPVILKEGGATKIQEHNPGGKSPVAVWDGPEPGAPVFDAVHRALLIRFPTAAETIASLIQKGKEIVQLELELEYDGTELFPVGYELPGGMSFLQNLWQEVQPRWHVVAWRLNKPWIADPELGPTFNAHINGKVFWKQYGARDEEDRILQPLGPVEISHQHPKARIDLTPCFQHSRFGKDLGERIRKLAECGLILKKWEVYDASFWRGGYEWGTCTGGRGIFIKSPKLVLYVKNGKSQSFQLPPPTNIHQLITEQKGRTRPTAVLPDDQQIEQIIAKFRLQKPHWMKETTWQRIQELLSLSTPNNLILFPENKEEYLRWIDQQLALTPRRWDGFNADEILSNIYRFKEAMPNYLLEHWRLYWWAWLMPDREIQDLVQGYIGYKDFETYYQQTRDWRGNFSVYRTYCRAMGTMNFNHWASAGTLLGGGLLESNRLLREGRHGLTNWPLKTWCWFDGSTQESIDHYYFAHSLKSQKVFADFGPTIEDRLMGRAILAKSLGELASFFHPNLKRFSAPSGRTGVAYTYAIQDGVHHILHTILPDGSLTDLNKKTIGENIPVAGGDFPPHLAAQLTLDGLWAPEWFGQLWSQKTLPYEACATYKRWGAYTSTPLWKKTYQARHFGVASIDIAAANESIPFIIHWRRENKPVTSSEQLGTMIGRFGVNRTELLDSIWHNSNTRNPNGSVGDQGGPTHIFQHQNKLIILTSPYRGLLHQDRPRGVPDEVRSFQTTLGIISLGTPDLEIRVDGTPVSVPIQLRYGSVITLRDGITFIGIRPIPPYEKLPRDVDIEIVDDGVRTEMQGGGFHKETLRINAYIRKSDTPLPKDQWDSDEIDQAYGGFIIEVGSIEEFKDFQDFNRYFLSTQLKSHWDGRNLHLQYQTGKDLMEVTFVPQETCHAPTTNVFPKRLVNGQWPYLPEGTERECPLSIISTRGEISKNGVTYVGEKGKMAYLLTDPTNKVYNILKPYPEKTVFRMVLPNGSIIQPNGKIGICNLTVELQQNRVSIDCGIPEEGESSADAFFLKPFSPSTTFSVNGIPVNPIQTNEWTIIPLLASHQTNKSLSKFSTLQKVFDRLINPNSEEILASYLKHWMILEPFPKGFNTEFPPETKPFNPKEKFAGKQGEISWVYKEANSQGEVLLNGTHATAYAFTRIKVDKPMKVFLFAGSDDTLSVWVNRKRVWHHEIYRPMIPDEDQISIELQPGINDILVKVCQGEGGWGFCIRLVDSWGLPLPEIAITAKEEITKLLP